MVGLLLNWGADPGIRNNDGKTPLTLAKARARKRTISLLEGAPSPLQMAVIREDLGAIEGVLANGADPNVRDASGRTALAAAVNFPEVVKRLIEAGASVDIADNEEIAPLQLAARSGNLDVVSLLIEAGADPNRVDRRGTTPLLAAAQNRHPEVGARLLDAGANPNAKNRSDESPLFHAVAHRQHDLLVALLAAGANYEAVMTNGMMALGFTVSMAERSSTEALLGAGAKVDAIDRAGRTALVIAAARGNDEIVRVLLDAGARNVAIGEGARAPLVAALEGQHASTALILLEADADPNARNHDRESVLQIASEIAAPAVVAALIERGAQRVDFAGEQALLAVMRKLERSSPRDSSMASRDSRERTSASEEGDARVPLQQRYREIATALVRAGANVNWRPEQGESAYAIAARLGLRDLVEATADPP